MLADSSEESSLRRCITRIADNFQVPLNVNTNLERYPADPSPYLPVLTARVQRAVVSSNPA